MNMVVMHILILYFHTGGVFQAWRKWLLHTWILLFHLMDAAVYILNFTIYFFTEVVSFKPGSRVSAPPWAARP